MVHTKKLFIFSAILCLFVGFAAAPANAQLGPSHINPGSDSSNSLTGPVKKEYVMISNEEINNIGSGLALANQITKRVPYTQIFGLGSFGANLITKANHANNGVLVTLTLQYGTKEVFDGQWVEHTGWHLVGQSYSTY